MEKLLEDIKQLLQKWINDREKILNKAERTLFLSKKSDLLQEFETKKELYEELFKVYHNTLDRLKSDNN